MVRYKKSEKMPRTKKISIKTIKRLEKSLEKRVNNAENTKLVPTSTLVEILGENNIAEHKTKTAENTETQIPEEITPAPTPIPPSPILMPTAITPTNPLMNNYSSSIKKNLSSHTLDTAADAEMAVREFMEGNPNNSFSRAQIMDELYKLTNVKNNKKSLANTKGGVKTGIGKPRWQKNVAWAIQKLYANNQIIKTGKNQYTMSKSPASAKPMPSSPTTKKTAVRNSNKSSVNKVATPKAQQPPQDITIKNITIQPPSTPSTPNPPPVVEHIVEPKKETSAHTDVKGNMDLSNVIITKEVPYIPNPAIDRVIEAHFNGSTTPIMFVGAAGIGKTIGVEAFAAKHQVPFIEIQATPNTDEDELLGHQTVKATPQGGTYVEYEYGAIPRAIDAANKYGSAILLIDEFNLLRPEVQVIFNPLTDYRKEVTINERKEKIQLKDGKKLLVIATRNPSSYGGTNQIQEAVASRFIPVFIDYPALATEREILAKKTGVKNQKLITDLIKLASYTRKKDSGQPEISTRTLENALRIYKDYENGSPELAAEALTLAIKNAILGQFMEDPAYQEEVRRQFIDIFDNTKKKPKKEAEEAEEE